MSITSFQFSDSFHDWKLQQTSFNSFNLLVGISGVGKTQILNALQVAQQAGIGNVHNATGCQWVLDLVAEEKKYRWSVEISPRSDGSAKAKDSDDYQSPHFLRETIVRDDKDVLVERSEKRFTFKGKPLPKLKNNESAITLLRDEEQIAPVNKALRRFLFSEAAELTSAYVPFDAININKMRSKYNTIESLREATGIPPLVKAYILQEQYPKEFQQIKDDYAEIFQTVTDIKLGKLSDIQPFEPQERHIVPWEWLALGIHEKGIRGWVTNKRLSSGMLRTLIHLIELALTPPDTVVVIDEIENSLGLNCLHQLIDRLLSRSKAMQFIITSHHPYIINNVPSEWWKIVTRKGREVIVKDQTSISALNTKSSHDKFLLLTNLEEYEEGIQ